MIKKSPLVLYIGNHNKLVGIVDYIKYFKYLSAKYKFKLKITKKLSKKIKNILIIEEFSNYFENIKLKKFLKNWPSKKTLILTEFTDNKKKIFNSFQHSKIDRKINYFFIPIYISYLLYFHTKLFVVPRFHTGIIKNLKLILKQKKKNDKNKSQFNLISNVKNFFYKYKNYIYFKSRYLFTNKYINLFDYILLSHQNIILPSNSNKKLKYYTINFSNFKKIKIARQNLHFDFSGELNQYRRNKLREIIFKLKKKKITNIKIDKLKHYISIEKNTFIKSTKKKNKTILSLHIEKSKKWPFSSPTRYINSLNKNELPIVVKKFDDDYTKNTTLYLYDLIHTSDLNKTLDRFEAKLSKYKDETLKYEEKLVEKLIS